jgi:hypothetical protein
MRGCRSGRTQCVCHKRPRSSHSREKVCDNVRYLKLSNHYFPFCGGSSHSLRKEHRLVLARSIFPTLRSLTIDYCGTFGDPYYIVPKPFLLLSNIPALPDLAVLKAAFDERHMASFIELY